MAWGRVDNWRSRASRIGTQGQGGDLGLSVASGSQGFCITDLEVVLLAISCPASRVVFFEVLYPGDYSNMRFDEDARDLNQEEAIASGSS